MWRVRLPRSRPCACGGTEYTVDLNPTDLGHTRASRVRRTNSNKGNFMLLNVTHAGNSTEYELGDVTLEDTDVRRVAAELLSLDVNVFAVFVVDRFDNKVYLRPKVPFGSLQ